MISRRRRAALTAIIVTSMMIIPATPVTHASTTEATRTTEDPDDPDRPGGQKMFDGMQSEKLTQTGRYGMIYYYKQIKNEEACERLASNWPVQDIKAYRKDNKTNPLYRRMSGRFSPLDRPLPVFPNQTPQYTTSRSDTESWQHSASITVTGGLDFKIVKLSVEFKYQFTYKKEITTTKGRTLDAPNKTSNKIIYYQYGVTHDVFSMQETPWRATWRADGERIFVGDDSKAIARWYTTKEPGCYRTALFSSISLPAQETLVPIARVPFKEGQTTAPQLEKACQTSVNGGPVHPATKVDFEGMTFFPEDEEKTFEQGECITLTDRWNDDTGELWFETNEPTPDGGYYWLPENNVLFITPAARTAKPMPGWEKGTKFILRPVARPDLAIAATPGQTRYTPLSDQSDETVQWMIDATPYPNTWRLRSVGAQGQCLDLDTRRAYMAHFTCTNDKSQAYRLILEDDAVFYIQETLRNDHCAAMKGEGKVGDFTGFSICDADQSMFKSRWKLELP